MTTAEGAMMRRVKVGGVFAVNRRELEVNNADTLR